MARGTVVHVVERLSPGGIETLVLDIVRSGGGDDRVFSLSGTVADLGRAWPKLAELGPSLEAFGRRGLSPALIGRLAARLRTVRPEAVFVHHIGPLLYGGVAARLAGVRRLVHVEHDGWHYEDPGHRRLARWCAATLRPEVIAVSAEVAERTRAVMPGRTVRVVPPGIPTDRFRPRDRAEARRALQLDADRTLVGTVGRLVPVKGQAHLIDALALLPATVDLAIVGDGPERAALDQRAGAAGLGGRVRFLGHRDDLDAIYPAFDVFCLPSLAEGMPRTLLESQACGIPAVASAVGGVPEAVCPATGRLVPPADPAALAAALADVLAAPGDPGETRRFVERRAPWAETLAAYAAAGTG
jgi:glycosyltransferase involved in cell wall biosynthesis